jgi:hypothetical protein
MTENGILGTDAKGSRIYTVQDLLMRPDFSDRGRSREYESLKTQTRNHNFLHSGLPKTVDFTEKHGRLHFRVTLSPNH